MMLGAGPALASLIVQPEDWTNITLDELLAWRTAVLVRDQVQIASAGPLSVDAVAKVIDKLFAGLPATAPARAIPPVPSMRALGKTIVIERPVVQTMIVAGGPSGWHIDIDALPSLLAVQAMLGFEGALWRAVRERLGATYGVAGSLVDYHPKARGFVIGSHVDNSRAIAALAAIKEEYAKIIRGGVEAERVDALKVRMLSVLRESFRKSPSAAGQVLFASLAQLPNDHIETIEARISAITPDIVAEGLKTKFPTAPLSVAIVAPSAEGFDADCVIKSLVEMATCERP
jgi:zinc protease